VTSFLVQCGGGSSRPAARAAEKVQVRLYKPNATASFQFWNLTHALLQNLSPRYQDLLEIAAYVYIADTECKRWSERDLLNTRWQRDFQFIVPVQEPDFWNNELVKESLQAALARVTGDSFQFRFTKRRRPTEQLFFKWEHLDATGPIPNCVSLLSGGADSLAGALYLLEELRLTPLLVSHRSVAVLDTRQQRLANSLRERYGASSLGHVSLWLHRKGSQAREVSQRSRGFLFLALATVVAKQLGIGVVFVPENGPVSLNVRKLQQSYSTTLSQTTHPEFITAFERLANLVGGVPLSITNPFILETKVEVLNRLRQHKAERLLEETVSCAHTQGRSTLQPHCGVCSQCVDRRFASIAAGLEHYDDASRYERDIFREDIPEGESRMQVESHLRFASRIARSSDEAILSEYPELLEAAAALGLPLMEAISELVKMLQRHAQQITGALGQMMSSAMSEMLAGELPLHCAIRLAANAEHLRELPERTAAALAAILRPAFPLAFQSRQPDNEREIQDHAESILRTHGSGWLREGPLLPFTVVKTKPDFARKDLPFFVEMKYPKTRERLNTIVTEITSRITIYSDQGASVLFVVYDPARTITDDDAFVRPLRDHKRVFVEIVR